MLFQVGFVCKGGGRFRMCLYSTVGNFNRISLNDTGCASVESPYVLRNLYNLSVGLSNIEDLQNLALRPFLARTRVSGTYGNHLARTHIKTWMSIVGWNAEEDEFYANTPYGRRSFSNVVATLDPSKTRRLVLACHYDSKLMHRFRFVGATDAAVPCSLLMDSAWRLYDFFMGSKSTDSDLTLQFIFFDGEEAFVRWSAQDSLYGSRHLAERWASTPDPQSPQLSYLETIDTFILMDLIGTSDTHFKMRFRETAPIYYKLQSIESCLRDSGLLSGADGGGPLFTAQTDYTFIDDDHSPFYDRGVPIVHLITSPYPSVWHTPRDDLPALDFDRIENLARVLRVYFMDLRL